MNNDLWSIGRCDGPAPWLDDPYNFQLRNMTSFRLDKLTDNLRAIFYAGVLDVNYRRVDFFIPIRSGDTKWSTTKFFGVP